MENPGEDGVLGDVIEGSVGLDIQEHEVVKVAHFVLYPLLRDLLKSVSIVDQQLAVFVQELIHFGCDFFGEKSEESGILMLMGPYLDGVVLEFVSEPFDVFHALESNE